MVSLWSHGKIYTCFMCLYQYAAPVCDTGLTPQLLESFLIENRLQFCASSSVSLTVASETAAGRGRGELHVWTVAFVA
jgi:hypothetical protein